MRSILFSATLTALCALTLGIAAASEQGPAAYENLDKYIGRALITDERAQRADISRMLPLSCPPFHLRDIDGKVIDPTQEEVTRPVSTKQTCGACHDYDRITRGYHFQMGRNEMYPDAPIGEGVSPHRSPGFFGKWQLLYQRELAPKNFADPTAVDMTAFDWISNCGICHPGGGPAEYDRARRRYDEVVRTDPMITTMGNGDYYGADWASAGVVEADCFICHLDTYEYSTRAQNIKKLNYQWAATAASGLGHVWGSRKDGQQPKVYYHKELFRPDGKVDLKIRRPTDRQCTFCHDMSGVQKRGTTWHTHYMQDVHTAQGLRCIDCHQGDIRHNFAKGISSGQSVRDDLDRTMLSCEQCHEAQEQGAPDYDHPGLPKLHFSRLGCTACHITHRPFVGTRTVDTLQGKAMELPVQPDAATVDSIAFGATWGSLAQLTTDNLFAPFTREEIQAAARYTLAVNSPLREYFLNEDGSSRLAAKPLRPVDLVEDGSVASNPDACALMLVALEETALREDESKAVCVLRGQSYVLDSGKLAPLPTALQPRRAGAAIAEYPVTYAINPQSGQIEPEGYQLGAFWAYLDHGVARPFFLKDMKAAWDFLHSEQFHIFRYPAKPASGKEAPLPAPKTLTDAEMHAAIRAKLAAYQPAERQRVDVYDDNNDSVPEANSKDEIGLVAWALTRTAPRLEEPVLFYIKGDVFYRVEVQDADDPYTHPLRGMAPLAEGKSFLAIDRYEQRRRATKWDYALRWEYAETRLANMFAAKVEQADANAHPAVAQLARRLSWTISHGVEPASQALGANGCTDCHAADSHFFFGPVMLDPFGEDAAPVTTPMHEKLGYSRGAILLGAYREGLLKPLSPWLVLAVAVAIILHYTLFGSKNRSEGYEGQDVLRFRLHERLAHLIGMTAVTFLAVTGFCFLLSANDPLGPWARMVHTIVGYAAAVGVAGMFLFWALTMLPAKGDFAWLKGFGGYLGGKGHYPAGKFNAGQKILFWLSVAMMAVLAVTGVLMKYLEGTSDARQSLLFTAHDIAGLVMILTLLGHVYLAVVINPHCLRSLFGGKVKARWAQEHHPDWKPRQ